MPPKKCVLIVDDHRAFKELLESVLVDEGYQVISASNGQEALEVIKKQPLLPAVIMLDLVMPLMDGWTLTEVLEKDSRLSKIPRVVMSSIDLNVRKPPRANAVMDKFLDMPSVAQLVKKVVG